MNEPEEQDLPVDEQLRTPNRAQERESTVGLKILERSTLESRPIMSLPEVQVEGERAQYLCRDCRAPHPVQYTISSRFKTETEVEEALAILVHYRQFHPTPELDARVQALKWVVGRIDRV